MLQELKNQLNQTETENGAVTFRTSGSDCVDFFATVGALRSADDAEIMQRFIRAYAENPDAAMKILFFARDIRGGLGERRVFRVILRDLTTLHPASVIRNLPLIAEYGRFDDLLCLLGTPCEDEALKYLKTVFSEDMEKLKTPDVSVSLLGKWLPSINASNSETVQDAVKIARAFGLRHAAYRRALTALRARIKIIENNLREKDYTFSYQAVPSRALMKYRQAFMRNDGERYHAFLDAVSSGKSEMHTAAIEPYDIVKNVLRCRYDMYFYGDEGLKLKMSEEEIRALDVTWNALPDYTTDEDSIVVVDGSGSMYAGDPSPISVAISLGIYFAERNKGEFKNHFITFSTSPQLVEIKGADIVQKVCYCMSFNEVANTNLERVFRLILETAVQNRLPQSSMPARIYIVSDMEFDSCVWDAGATNFQNARRMFEEAGYHLPDVIFWNVESRNRQQPVRANDLGVALVSGCTPRLFTMMMSGEMTPYKQMMEILESERYQPIRA